MEADDALRCAVRAFGGDVWSLIHAAVDAAAREYPEELRARRDAIVEQLYAPPVAVSPARSPQEDEEEVHEREVMNGESCLGKVLAIKDFIDDPDQPEESLIRLLENLGDMDITYDDLMKTDIGRHVNRLRKHSSGEVRGLVKELVSKWKNLVDEWMKMNSGGSDAASPAIIGDGDSPEKTHRRNSYDSHHVSDHKYFPNPQYGARFQRDRSESVEPRPLPTKPSGSNPNPRPSRSIASSSEELGDAGKLDSARRRLHENYQEAQNAKKQRTIQVVDIHEIPKPKKAFFRKSSGLPSTKHR